jgi:hypothetical protein
MPKTLPATCSAVMHRRVPTVGLGVRVRRRRTRSTASAWVNSRDVSCRTASPGRRPLSKLCVRRQSRATCDAAEGDCAQTPSFKVVCPASITRIVRRCRRRLRTDPLFQSCVSGVNHAQRATLPKATAHECRRTTNDTIAALPQQLTASACALRDCWLQPAAPQTPSASECRASAVPAFSSESLATPSRGATAGTKC